MKIEHGYVAHVCLERLYKCSADVIGNVLATGVQVYMSRKPLQVLLDQVPLADDDIVYNQSQALLRLQIPALGEGGHQEAGKGEETTGRKTRTRKITIFV